MVGVKESNCIIMFFNLHGCDGMKPYRMRQLEEVLFGVLLSIEFTSTYLI